MAPMDSESSGDETARSATRSFVPSLKRPRYETDEEDMSSSPSSSDSEDDELDTAFELPAEDTGHMITRTRREGPLRRSRYGAGRARADDFVATVRLMSEVEALRRQRDELMSLHYARVLNTGSRDNFINTIIEYYDTFRDGFRGPRLPDIYRFFDNRLDRELFAYGGGGLGLDTWIEQWRRYTRMFPSISMRLRSLNVIDLADSASQTGTVNDDPTVATCMIDTQGILDGIISRQAVCTVFPHLRHREDLIQKLVGRSLNLPMNLRFYFNNAGRVIRYDFDGDYFQAFSRVEDVGLVELTEIMEHVAIGENSTVPDLVELVEEDEAPRDRCQ